MQRVTFAVSACPDTGGFVARWDDPAGGGITTQGETMTELEAMVSDAVEGYCFDRPRPARVRLHFIDDPDLAFA